MKFFYAISVSPIYFLYIFHTTLSLLLVGVPSQAQDSRTRLYSSWRVLSLPEKSNRTEISSLPIRR